MAEPNTILDQVIQDIEAICEPLDVPVLHKHDEEPSPKIRVEVSPEPGGVVRVILYPGPATDDVEKFGERLDAALIQLFTEQYEIAETVRGEGFGNTWRIVAHKTPKEDGTSRISA